MKDKSSFCGYKINIFKLSVMEQLNMDRLMSILKIQSNGNSSLVMQNHIINELKNIPGVSFIIDIHSNIIASKGDNSELKVMLCAHTDTVHQITPDYKVLFDKERGCVSAYPVGIGGDDKCGIYGCLELLRVLPNVKVGFFALEESGCIGSSQLDSKYVEDVSCFLGIDRKGNRDFITSQFTSTISDELRKVVIPVACSLGYHEETGMITDSLTLGERFELSAMNISCGYYNPHKNNEYIVLDELQYTVNAVRKIVEAIQKTGIKYPHPVKENYDSYTNYSDTDFDNEIYNNLHTNKRN
jgi:di/tripeptidase